MKNIKSFKSYLLENYLQYFSVNDNKYWFEVRDPKDEKGYRYTNNIITNRIIN